MNNIYFVQGPQNILIRAVYVYYNWNKSKYESSEQNMKPYTRKPNYSQLLLYYYDYEHRINCSAGMW